MKALKLILSFLILPALLLTSCDDNDPNHNTGSLTLGASDNIILSTYTPDNSLQVLPGANYRILVDYDLMTCNVTVNDLQFDSQQSAISFTIPETRIAVSSSGWLIRRQEAFTVETSRGTATISNFDLEFTMRVGGSSALAMLEFDLDGKYHISTLLTTSNFVGTTSSTIIGNPDQDPFSTQTSTYSVIVNRETAKAQIRIYNPKFSNEMPSNLGTMVFDNIPVTFTSKGFAATPTEIIPEIATAGGSDPYPQFKITNLDVAYVAGMHLDMEFDCAAFNRHVKVSTSPY